MRFEDITATPHPGGNRIDLTWVNPEPEDYPGICVVRRTGTHPTSPADGTVVASSKDLPHLEIGKGKHRYEITDAGLQSETVYYYTLLPYTADSPLDENGNPTDYVFEPHNRAAALATAPYDMAGRMYQLLPGIYHRYDDEDRPKGPLRHFLDLPGGQLDQLHSMARAMLDLHNIKEVDGRLLPLLAQWIGWQLDYRQEMAKQRNEIRDAPYVQATIGIIPTVEATVKRVLGWECRTKEFLHNVFLSNRPERLNLWARERSGRGEWSEPTEPLSLDFAYEGRPTAVRDGGDTLWLFYQARKGRWDAQHKRWKDGWDIWYKTLSTFSVWAPSQPLTHRGDLDRHPSAAAQGNTLWVFWDVYDEEEQRWRVECLIREGDENWSPCEDMPFGEAEGLDGSQRKRPWAVADNQGGVWLFWLEKAGTLWQLKYNRHNGSTWQSKKGVPFPLDAGKDPRVQSDLFVLFNPKTSAPSIWVFWAYQVRVETSEGAEEPDPTSKQRRWQIAYRVKRRISPIIGGWGKVHTFKPAQDEENPTYHDREPAAWVNGDEKVELFWGSNRDGSWSVWCSTLLQTLLVPGTEKYSWKSAKPITTAPYSQRDPLPMALATDMLLFYRSNQSLTYASAVYGATETFDARYAGCTTVDTRNLSKIALRGQYEDFQTYTHDTGQNGKRTDQNWYAGDTVGIYFTPDTDDLAQIAQGRELIEDALRQFLPIQVRAAFILDAAVHKEWVDTCIGEQFSDRITTTEG